MTNPTFTEQDIKEMYNKDVKQETKGEYEFFRWFSNKETKTDYKMTHDSIWFHLRDIKFKIGLELGPGPGTWTKLLLKKNPSAELLLVDISIEMLKQSEKNLKGKGKIKYKEQNFSNLEISKKFDLFFSSRAIEYIINKQEVVKKIKSLLNKNGTAIIITKLPHPLKLKFRKLIYKKINKEHTERIGPSPLKDLLIRNGFRDIEIYPVIMPPKMPIVCSSLRFFIFKLFYKKQLNFFSRRLSESYLIKFKK